ncbi:MAG: glycosyltransferase family 4 protein [Muribaculaceae bacterium]|nr:glycosyltransferase family 4 protein [Muribaculaceae bacterium]
MNIAYVIGSLSTHGGLQRILADKTNALCRMPDVNVFIICTAGCPESRPAFEIDSQVHIVYNTNFFEPGKTKLHVNPFLFGIKLLRWRRSRRNEIKRFVQTHNIDIIVYNTYNSYYMPCRPGCKVIVESHTERASTKIPQKRKFLRRLRSADALVAITDADCAQWPEARRTFSIPNFTTFKPATPYNPDTRRVMAAGRLDVQKGFDILVNAWRTVARVHPDWSLDIYYVPYAGIELADLLSLINEADLSHCINLCEASADMAATFSEHSLFVLSSRYEGFGLVLIEAMACGVPCVSFDCPEGPSEIITDGEDGWLVPFRGLSDEERADALADALCDAIANRDKRLRFSDTAQKSVRRFTPEVVMPQWLDLFNSITSHK